MKPLIFLCGFGWSFAGFAVEAGFLRWFAIFIRRHFEGDKQELGWKLISEG